MTTAIVVDTGVLYATADTSDADHQSCTEFLEAHDGPLYVPTLVAGEVVYLTGDRLGPEAEVAFLGSLASGQLLLEHPSQADLLRMAELVWRYRDWPLGTVDASLIALAERLGISMIATLDHRHFAAVRPHHVEVFELLP